MISRKKQMVSKHVIRKKAEEYDKSESEINT